MYGYGSREKYKWKRRVVTGAYITFLLAEFGEFFVSHEPVYHNSNTGLEQTETGEIPDHVPEKSGKERFQLRTVCFNPKINAHLEKCVEVLIPA